MKTCDICRTKKPRRSKKQSPRVILEGEIHVDEWETIDCNAVYNENTGVLHVYTQPENDDKAMEEIDKLIAELEESDEDLINV